MPPEFAPWAVISGFVVALGLAVIAAIRGLMSGRIVAGRHYDDARDDEGRWRAVAEAGVETNRELVSHVGRLTAAVEASNATAQQILALSQQIMQHLVLPALPAVARVGTDERPAA